MPRAFVFFILGIIGLITLSYLPKEYVYAGPEGLLLDTVVGVVGGGNFSYWQLGHPGLLIVELTSLTGDADLYVSDSMRPNFDLEGHNISSVTCGKDMAYVPEEFPRPIGIGVYGHWRHSMSEFRMQVFLDLGLKSVLAIPITHLDSDIPEAKNNLREAEPTRKPEEEKKPRFLKLLSILDMIFEMFVL